ncbi:ATPase, T2SS/T4P/T4SS family [Halorubrum sp. DTA98]|uniref:ATPase, T2SS/T4P/T4SS family n=1 Tax=Halorubrum sp. DTA98 TaxID=3402163 RepID=UPI003AABD7FE
MAIEDAERSPEDDGRDPSASDDPATTGRYTWREFLEEHGHADDAAELYERIPSAPAVEAADVKARVDAGSLNDSEGIDGEHATDGTRLVDGAEPADEVGPTDEAEPTNGGDDAAKPADVVLSHRSVVSPSQRPTGAGDEASPARDDERSPASHGGSGTGSVVVDPTDVDVRPARRPTADDWERVDVDPSEFLGFDPAELPARLHAGGTVGDVLWDRCAARYDPYEVPVLKGYYTWDDFEAEFFFDENGDPPTDEEGAPLSFTEADRAEALGFDPALIEGRLSGGADAAAELAELVDERTVNVNPAVDEDDFFSTADGQTTLANRYDLEKAVPMAKKTHFREEERYWVNEPYAFIVVFHSTKENEKKYYAVQPYLTRIETDLQEFLTGKLRTSIKYADESIAGGDEAFREGVISEETQVLLDRFDLYDDEGSSELLADVVEWIERLNERSDRFDVDPEQGVLGRILRRLGYTPPEADPGTDAGLAGIAARPEPAVLAEDRETLTEYQVEKLLYYLRRDFIGYERIDPIKHDINVEDISCDGYDSPVFVYHSEYEQIISNVYHGTEELDDFVVKLAQRSGKGISKRRPQVDATLPDGSRAQLTLGREVSDHGTNYTIRQFNDVPFTPVDLINWKTFSLDQMAFLWLCIENHKSLLFAGGTASGKTTSLNAVSLFIPSNAKIVSIEDTREVELPQRNWIASVTRPSFSEDDKGDVDEFDLLEAALRQRPDYIVMGEIRGEEGRTAFQVMSTGHTTYTTFHADSVGEVLKRFTTDPINVSKTMFTALDLVSVQSSTRVQGRKVRRNKSLTEINHYDAENDEINVQDVYQWQAETDEFLQMGDSNTLEEIMFDRGWNRTTLDAELRKRRIVLAYLIDRGLNTYAEVAATFQAFINDPETILALMATDGLERSLEDLREMESVLIDVDPETESMVPRPDPDDAGREEVERILADAEDLFDEYRGVRPDSVADALLDLTPAADVAADPDADRESLAAAARAAVDLDTERDGEPVVGDRAAETGDGLDPTGGVVWGRPSGDGEPADVTDDADAPDGTADATGGTADSAARDDSGSGGIDFDEPFDEGIDVMGPESLAEPDFAAGRRSNDELAAVDETDADGESPNDSAAESERDASDSVDSTDATEGE